MSESSSKKMKNCCPYTLIFIGAFNLLLALIYTVGFNSILKATIPMTMRNLPLNETMKAWITVPLGLEVSAALTNASTSNEELANGTLALGKISLNIEMAMGEADEAKVFPIVWMQEDGSIDEVVRYMMVLSSGPLNYAKYYSRSIAAFLVVVAIIGAMVWFKKRKELTNSKS